MNAILTILIGSIFVNNFAMSRFYGICPFLGVSKKLETAFHLPLQEARAALGVRGAVDVDTSREGAFWASDGQAELLREAAE